MLRRLSLRLSHPDDYLVHQNSLDAIREDIWLHWLPFFNPSNDRGSCTGFPALDRLLLDFTDWQLGVDNNSQLRVSPRQFALDIYPAPYESHDSGMLLALYFLTVHRICPMRIA